MITDHGSATLAVAIPAADGAAVAIDAVCAIAAPQLSLQLDAILAFTPSVTLSLAAQIDIALGIVANLQAAVLAGVTPPTLDAQVSAALAVAATIGDLLASIQVQLDVSVALHALLANGGVRLLSYAGPQDDFGAELAAELGGATTASNAVVLLTSNGTSWAAMQTIFGI